MDEDNFKKVCILYIVYINNSFQRLKYAVVYGYLIVGMGRLCELNSFSVYYFYNHVVRKQQADAATV